MFKKKPPARSGWTQELFEAFIRHFGSSNIGLLITRAVHEVEITRPEERERYFMETLTFYGHLAVPESDPLLAVNVRLHVVASDGLLRVPEAASDSEARFRGYLALANQDAFQLTLPVLHVTLPGDEKARNCLLESLTRSKQFTAPCLPIYIWADIATFRGNTIDQVLQWNRTNFPTIERCRFTQTLDLSAYRF